MLDSFTDNGWETTYSLYKTNIKNDSDLVILFTNWLLTLHNDFKCIGLGTEKLLMTTEIENAFEMLPEGWNDGLSSYNIRYICGDILYILSGINIMNRFHLYFIQPNAEIVAHITFECDTLSKFKKLIPHGHDFREFFELIQNEIVNDLIMQYTSFCKSIELRRKQQEKYKENNKCTKSLQL